MAKCYELSANIDLDFPQESLNKSLNQHKTREKKRQPQQKGKNRVELMDFKVIKHSLFPEAPSTVVCTVTTMTQINGKGKRKGKRRGKKEIKKTSHQEPVNFSITERKKRCRMKRGNMCKWDYRPQIL